MSGIGNTYKKSGEDILKDVHNGLYAPQYKALDTSASGVTLIWTPGSGKTIVATDIVLSAASAVNVKIGFGPDVSNITYKTAAIQLTANNLVVTMCGLLTPFIADAADENLYVHLSGAVQIGGFIAGHECSI